MKTKLLSLILGFLLLASVIPAGISEEPAYVVIKSISSEGMPDGVCAIWETCTFDATGSLGNSFKWYIETDSGQVQRNGKITTFVFSKTDLGTRYVQLVAKDTVTGESEVAEKWIKVVDGHEFQSNPPIAIIDVSPSPADEIYYTNQKITFDGSASRDTDNQGQKIVKYLWMIREDGQYIIFTENTAQISYTFTKVGTHSVGLIVTDDEGQTAAQAISIVVKEKQGNGGQQPPVTILRAIIDAPSSADVGEVIEFSASKSTGEIISYNWDFGDGGFDSNEEVEYAYDTAGLYTVTLTVRDDAGRVDYETMKITINRASSSGGSELDGSELTPLGTSEDVQETTPGASISGELKSNEYSLQADVGKESMITLNVKNNGRLSAKFIIDANADWANVEIDNIGEIDSRKSKFVDIRVTPKEEGVHYLNLDLLADGKTVDSADIKFTVGGQSVVSNLNLMLALLAVAIAAIGGAVYLLFFVKKPRFPKMETY